MDLLSKDAILAADDRRYEEVAVPEWGGNVRVRTLTGRERDSFEASLQEQRGAKTKQNIDNFRARLVSLCLVDGDNNLMFTSKAEVVMLGNKSVAALQRVFNKCNDMNGFSDEDVEELTEGFEEVPEGSSTSG